jgi:hypothetical protein
VFAHTDLSADSNASLNPLKDAAVTGELWIPFARQSPNKEKSKKDDLFWANETKVSTVMAELLLVRSKERGLVSGAEVLSRPGYEGGVKHLKVEKSISGFS